LRIIDQILAVDSDDRGSLWLMPLFGVNPQTEDYEIWPQQTTLCLKKVPTLKLSVTLSNLNRFSKNFALLESL